MGWHQTVHLQPGAYQDRYVVDGMWNDQLSQKQVPNEFVTFNDVVAI